MAQTLTSLIDVATDEKQTEDDWTKILEVCERGTSNPKECLRIIMKRLFNRNPHIVLRSIILLDACVQNIGEPFAKELSSKYFVDEIKSRSKNMHQKTLERLCFMMKKWTRELTSSEYDCIKQLNRWLQETYPTIYAAGDDEINSKNIQKGSRKSATAQEEEEIAKAIALSLKDSEPKRSNSLYPTATSALSQNSVKLVNDVPNLKRITKVRALYDFEAAEDNELSFKAGEIIVDVDTSNEHWWSGSNHRGEGLFPAQFVTIDVEPDLPKMIPDSSAEKNISQPISQSTIDNVIVRPPTPVIDELKIDECLRLIDESDPTGEMRPDPPDLMKFEAQCRLMGPMIDQELERVDRHYNTLVDLNRKVIESFQMYNELMMQSGIMRPTGSFQWPQTTSGPHPATPMMMMYHQQQQQSIPPVVMDVPQFLPQAIDPATAAFMGYRPQVPDHPQQTFVGSPMLPPPPPPLQQLANSVVVSQYSVPTTISDLPTNNKSSSKLQHQYQYPTNNTVGLITNPSAAGMYQQPSYAQPDQHFPVSDGFR